LMVEPCMEVLREQSSWSTSRCIVCSTSDRSRYVLPVVWSPLNREVSTSVLEAVGARATVGWFMILIHRT
jgi:hypothetical protein